MAWADYDGTNYNIWYKRSGYGWPLGYSYKPSKFEDRMTEDFKLSPNPATTMLDVNTSGHYQVSNMLGQVLQMGDLYIGKHTIDVSKLPAGNYIINFSKPGEKPVTINFSKL